jgi:hypothetical protein
MALDKLAVHTGDINLPQIDFRPRMAVKPGDDIQQSKKWGQKMGSRKKCEKMGSGLEISFSQKIIFQDLIKPYKRHLGRQFNFLYSQCRLYNQGRSPIQPDGGAI